jgi:uncharacterized membrane protein
MLLDREKIPGFGDRVVVTGNTYWYNAERGFILNSLSQLEITRDEPIQMTIAQVNELNPEFTVGYYRVNVTGTVSSWRQYYSSVDVTLIDGNGNEMSLYVPNSVMELTGTGPLGRLEVGMRIEAVGCLEYYDAGNNSKWEIIPANMDHVREV